MNHTFRTRSALSSAAKAGLRREQRRSDSGSIFAVCALVVAAYLLVEFIAQVAA